MGNKVIFWRYTVHIHDQIVHEGTPWETIDALRIRYAPPYLRNPNLKPVGKGFGFLVFDLKEYCGGMT